MEVSKLPPHDIIHNSGLLRSKSLSDYQTVVAGPLIPSLNQEREQLKTNDVPVIDMSLPRNLVAKAVAQACKEWGFFQVRNHGFPRELLERVRCCSHTLFELPFEQKEGASGSEDSHFSGYGYGMTQRTIFPNAWVEAFHFECNPVNRIQEVIGRLGLEPAELDNICGFVKEYASMVHNLALQLLELLAEGLGVDATTFSRHVETGNSTLRMNYYPPCPQPSVTQGLGPHKDYDFLTILLQDQVPGLQVLKEGEWLTVDPIPDVLVVNVGDLFQAWSNNRVQSTLHRSLVNSTNVRLSVPYFLHPDLDTIVSPPPDLMDAEKNPRHYRDFIVKDGFQVFTQNRGRKV